MISNCIFAVQFVKQSKQVQLLFASQKVWPDNFMVFLRLTTNFSGHIMGVWKKATIQTKKITSSPFNSEIFSQFRKLVKMSFWCIIVVSRLFDFLRLNVIKTMPALKCRNLLSSQASSLYVANSYQFLSLALVVIDDQNNLRGIIWTISQLRSGSNCILVLQC